MQTAHSPAATPAARPFASVSPRVWEVWRADRMPFREAWTLQKDWVELRKQHAIPDRLLFIEHSPVITLGRNARREHILRSEEELAQQGIELVECDRGGDVTFHGPGQLVGYPIVDLSAIRKDVGWYLRTLEEALIRTLRELDLDAARRAGMTGVWIGDSKVAAIGVHISRWITSHGFALNVDTDLRYFGNIVPCGIACYRVGSIRELRGATVSRPWLEQRIAGHLSDLLGLQIEWVGTEIRAATMRERADGEQTSLSNLPSLSQIGHHQDPLAAARGSEGRS